MQEIGVRSLGGIREGLKKAGREFYESVIDLDELAAQRKEIKKGSQKQTNKQMILKNANS